MRSTMFRFCLDTDRWGRGCRNFVQLGDPGRDRTLKGHRGQFLREITVRSIFNDHASVFHQYDRKDSLYKE
jgi:hypothetical protein